MRNCLPDAPIQPFGYPRQCRRILGGNVDARHHCYLCRFGSSIDHFGASRPLASEQSRSNRTHCLPYRTSGKRMRVRIPAHPLAGSVGPLALGPLHFEDAQESISRKHGELGGPPPSLRALTAPFSVAGRKRRPLEKTALCRGIPHQPRVKGFGGEHGQDHDGAEGQCPDPGLDRDHRAERDQCAEQ